MKIRFAEFWEECGCMIICIFIFLLIAALIACICIQCAPDKIIYSFTTGEETFTFEVSAVKEHTDSYYVFILTDGSFLTYYPKEGSIVTRTEILN